jgi:FtsZ-binding cell division protein ZapB
MKLHEAIEALSVLALRLEELQKQLVQLNQSAMRAGIQVEQALKDAERLAAWSQPREPLEEQRGAST